MLKWLLTWRPLAQFYILSNVQENTIFLLTSFLPSAFSLSCLSQFPGRFEDRKHFSYRSSITPNSPCCNWIWHCIESSWYLEIAQHRGTHSCLTKLLFQVLTCSSPQKPFLGGKKCTKSTFSLLFLSCVGSWGLS